MTKVSIIIPVYNAQEHLKEALNSALSQSLCDIEIVLVDDGSTDGSASIMEEYRLRDSRIMLIEQQNAGAGAARNAGIAAADGQFVAFLDADDWYPNDGVLLRLFEAAKTSGARICGGSFSIFEDGRVQTKFQQDLGGYTFSKEGMHAFSEYQFDYGYHRFIYDRALLTERGISFPNYRRYQDPPFFVAAMIAAEHFFAMKDVVYCYRAGHSDINWNSQKVLDLARGLNDVLTRARAAGLDALHDLTLSRLNGEFANILAQGLAAGDTALFRLLAQIDAARATDAPLLEPLARALGGENVGTYEMLDQARSELQKIRQSAPYRLSEAMLAGPRLAKQYLIRRRIKG